jgi:diguanylate cyclase (GGDEF)-like protein
LSDLVLVAVVVGITVSCGLRPGRSWLWLLAGLLVFATADVVYALRVAHATYVLGTPLDALWSAGMTMIATSGRLPSGSSDAWVRDERADRDVAGGRSTLAVPALATAVALTILVLGRWISVPPIATGLATATLLAAAVRTQLAFRQVVRLYDFGRQARTDSLTDLGNRRALHEHLNPRLLADRPESLAVLLVDLDHFKEVNDALGHDVGDDLLRQVGPRMGRVLEPSDLMVRLGGDEFAVVVGTGAGRAPEQTAQRLLDQLVEPFLLDGVTLRVGASIGIARCPEDAADANGLLRLADVAMYAAKADGGGVRRYDPTRDRHSRERLRMTEELRDALDGEELVVHYQPQCDVGTGVVVGVEALVRWQHPSRGLLPPDAFLPVVERTGLMPALTAVVLRQAVRQCRSWQDQGIDLGVSVNVSASSLLDERLGEQVAALLAEHGLAPGALTLELTENTLMADPERCRATLLRLSEIGVQLSIDDYGTGYCSLSYLQNLPVDELKLDRSFLTDLTHGPGAAIVRSTVDLAHALGLRLVAEGVEDEPSLELLRRSGCDIAQGYHLGRPQPADELTCRLLDGAGRPDRAPALRLARG